MFSIFISLFFINAYAGEVLPAGKALPYDSYTFTIPQAQELMTFVDFLEKTNLQNQELLHNYELLDQEHKNKSEELNKLINLYKIQESSYLELIDNNNERINQLERREKLSKIEKWIYFGLGASAVLGTFYVYGQASK